jgi:hypothetical protein
MRKQTKLVAVLSAAALLAIGASMTSFAAAAHWDQQDGEWVFVDRNGDRMTDVWKKSNGQWYYLDSDGYMAKEQVIEDDEDKYYVDANGARVTNAWVSLDNDDLYDDSDESESIDTVWMYFDATGKALGPGASGGNGEIKRLPYGDGQSGYFIFDNDGYMLSGWKRWKKDGSTGADADLYYLGTQDEGWARTSFQWLEIDPDIAAFNFDNIEDDENYKDECWFFFKTNGKAVVDDTAKYNNKTYSFDKWGRMLDLWVYPSEDSVASDSGLTNASASSANNKAAYYTEEEGDRRGNDWILAYPNTDYDNYGDDLYYFYLDAKGRPFKADSQAVNDNKLGGIGTAYRVDDDQPAAEKANMCDDVGVRAIKGSSYLFNKNGVMLTGLYYLGGTADSKGKLDENGDTVYKGANEMKDGYYYFTEDDYPSSVAGQMVTNKRITIDVNGDDETYYFDKDGHAYTMAIINGYLYGPEGQLVTDYGDGNTYARVKLGKIKGVESGSVTITEKGKEGTGFTGDADDEILINEKGKIKKGGKAKDISDTDIFLNDYIVDKEKSGLK